VLIVYHRARQQIVSNNQSATRICRSCISYYMELSKSPRGIKDLKI
jgi:hypothetical protein